MMEDARVREWHKHKKAVIEAEAWQKLPDGKKYCSSTFDISIAHCTMPMLNRMGQKVCGGNSYWQTDNLFNEAILEYIIKDWDKIYPKVLQILKNKETKALRKCQDYINEMQTVINLVEVSTYKCEYVNNSGGCDEPVYAWCLAWTLWRNDYPDKKASDFCHLPEKERGAYSNQVESGRCG